MNLKSEPIPFALPSIGKEEEEAVLRVLRSGWLTTGAEAREFEKEFSSYVGSRHSLAVNSATAGLHLCLEGLGVKKGDRVITTPYTFTATAEVIRYLGADPLFVDIDPETFNLDPASVIRVLKCEKGVKGLLPVHIGGRPAAMEELIRIKEERDIFLVEDAAHAFPLVYRDKFLGTWGDAGVYSFYATKTITTGEGGMVATDNSELARRISTMRLHGIDREIWDRYTSKEASWMYRVVEAGYKYNMPDILAAIGREQLKKAEMFFRKRKKIAEFYQRTLGELDFLHTPSSGGENAWHLYMVRLKTDKLSIGRDTFVKLLQAAGIGTSVHYIPLHIMPYYKDKYGYKPEDFPNTMKVFKSVFSLPIYPGMSEEQCVRVSDTVKNIGEAHYRGIH
ncbi:MAG: UDP-4-amino-4,6-dideoxy-N-acetyl-beta-L-altrosamine transaminase [Spirochaetes bacterium]|nr:MAG: UDP-4-amino-4,6-dideoxy-N-acetyl-beta-L-altrosamine transaminase [Spirochaetota bacterium]